MMFDILRSPVVDYLELFTERQNIHLYGPIIFWWGGNPSNGANLSSCHFSFHNDM